MWGFRRMLILIAAFFYILGVMTAVLVVMYFPEEIAITSGQMVIVDGDGNETPIFDGQSGNDRAGTVRPLPA